MPLIFAAMIADRFAAYWSLYASGFQEPPSPSTIRSASFMAVAGAGRTFGKLSAFQAKITEAAGP